MKKTAENTLRPQCGYATVCPGCGKKGQFDRSTTVTMYRPYPHRQDYALCLPVEVPYCTACHDSGLRLMRRMNYLFWPVFMAVGACMFVYARLYFMLSLAGMLICYLILRAVVKQRRKINRQRVNGSQPIKYLREQGWKRSVCEADFSRPRPYTPEDFNMHLHHIGNCYGYAMYNNDGEAIDIDTYSDYLFDVLTETEDFSD